ncbi:MAG: GumC family protein [Pikeienuella sp.]
MAEGASFGSADIKSVVRRRSWIVALCFLLLTPLAFGVAYILPAVYSATARILVESQQIPDELARSTVTASAGERLELIRQRLMTRQNLITIIEKHNLYQGYSDLSLSDKVEKIREDTIFQSIEFGDQQRTRGPASVAAFTISFNAPTPVLSAAVANEFVTMALDLNLKQRTERATETVAFFKAEVARIAREITDVEGRVIAFKGENADALPETLQYRTGEIAELEKQITEGEERRAGLDEQRREIELALTQGLGGVPDEQLTPEQAQLRELENALAQQRGVLAPTHPTVVVLERRIEALREQITPTLDADGNPVDPAEFQRSRLERQIRLITSEIEKIDKRNEESRAKLDGLRDAIGRSPQVDLALSSLTRRLVELRDQYTAASTKLAEAETGEKLEVNRQAERLVVIEQAQVPTEPDSPNRLAIAGLGAGASVMVGIGLVVLLELLNSSIRTSGDLQRKVKLRPIVVVPYIRTRREIRNRRARLATLAGVFLVGVPAALFAVDQYYLPLSVLAERFADKAGLNSLIELIERRF